MMTHRADWTAFSNTSKGSCKIVEEISTGDLNSVCLCLVHDIARHSVELTTASELS